MLFILYQSAGEEIAPAMEVENAVGTLVQLDPNSAHVEILRAYMQAQRGREHRKALERLARALERTDLSAALRMHVLRDRGQFESLMGGAASAIADLREAVRLAPSNEHSLTALTEAVVMVGEFDEATLVARRTVAIRADWLSHLTVARVLYYAARYEESPDPLSRACEARRAPVVCLFHGSALPYAGRHDEAVTVPSQACQSDPRYCAIYAAALHRAGLRQDAQKAIEKTASLRESDSVYNLACYQAVTGKLKRVQQDRGTAWGDGGIATSKDVTFDRRTRGWASKATCRRTAARR